MKNQTWGILAILLSIMFGSTYSIFSKFLLQRTIPETVILLSQIFTVIAAVVFFGLFPEVRNIYKFPNKKIGIMILVAMISGVIAPLLYMKGLSETLATNAIVTGRLSSVFMGIIGFVRLKEEMTVQRVIGTCLMFFGIYYITTRGFTLGFALDTGVMMVGVAAFFSALGNTIFRKYLQDIPVELAIFIRNGIGVIVFFVFVPGIFQIDHNIGVGLRPDTWMYFLGLALIPIFFAQYLWYSGLQFVEVSKAGLLSYLGPLFGIVLAYTLLGEPLGRYHLIGALFLIGGIFVSMIHISPERIQGLMRVVRFRGIRS